MVTEMGVCEQLVNPPSAKAHGALLRAVGVQAMEEKFEPGSKKYENTQGGLHRLGAIELGKEAYQETVDQMHYLPQLLAKLNRVNQCVDGAQQALDDGDTDTASELLGEAQEHMKGSV